MWSDLSFKIKTIENLISIKWNEGILYSAQSMKDVCSMYEFCKSLIGSELYNRDGSISSLKYEDIVIIDSKYDIKKDILNKRIVLLTNTKLLSSQIHILVSANFNKSIVNIYPPTYRLINNIGDLPPRQWLFIDNIIPDNLVDLLKIYRIYSEIKPLNQVKTRIYSYLNE